MKLKITNTRIFLFVLFVFIGFCTALLINNRVDNTITDEDIEYIAKIYNVEPSDPAHRDYESEVRLIKEIQDAVLEAAPLDESIPFLNTREVKDLYLAGKGLCFDRSRVIEKILRFYGFETRHIFIMSIKRTNSTIASLVSPQEPSHAVSGVLTKKGWLLVDSNSPWIALDSDGNPRSATDMRWNMNGELAIEWQSPPPPIYSDLAPFTLYYGLYSRDGKFYPPYHFVPNLHFGELLYNFSE